MQTSPVLVLLTSALAVGASSVPAQNPPPSASLVVRVADLIESKYFDEAKAATMARELRAAAARGEFDAIADPRELAAALSARLGREDGHLRVGWIAPAGHLEMPQRAGRERMPEEVRASRWNFGFRRVEILPGNVGLIELSEFADLDAASDWDSAPRRVADAALSVVERADALIFDLRDNGGGGGMADYLLSYFLPPDVVFSEMHGRARTHESRTLKRVGGRRRLNVPLYIVVSGRTGSAAEFFAYSLQAMRRATIVGERTAGAANPGMSFDLGDGFEVFVPLDTPVNRQTGSNWEGVGVQPDVPVDVERSLVRAHTVALEHVLRRDLPLTQARDARWALAALTSRKATRANPLNDFPGTNGTRAVRIESGRLVIQRERWPARILTPLEPDLFFVEGAPWRRVAFERDADGRVIALIELTSDGNEARWRKQAP